MSEALEDNDTIAFIAFWDVRGRFYHDCFAWNHTMGMGHLFANDIDDGGGMNGMNGIREEMTISVFLLAMQFHVGKSHWR